ncbi:uncharacterized protein LOC131950012 isoform X2 [Physella acuta]|uniref:uncharacterized protein LOC131950012 isoform X2 n=1 Tax=Physella acuta TaxID=109671 RepID=UPI0027DBB890|nr:uncharacterized protein LOC131950012 isoform X2 [Physella acuta]
MKKNTLTVGKPWNSQIMEEDLFQFLEPLIAQQGDDDPRDGDICMDFYDQAVDTDSTGVGQPVGGQPVDGQPVGQPTGGRFNSSISNTYDSGLGSVISPVYTDENQVVAGSITIQSRNKKTMPARLSQGPSPSSGQGNVFSPSSPYLKHAPYDISKRGRRDSRESQENGAKVIQANDALKPQLFAQSFSQPQPLFDLSRYPDLDLSRRPGPKTGYPFVPNPTFSPSSTHVVTQQHDVRTAADESPRMSKCRPETNHVLKERLGVAGRAEEEGSQCSPAKSPNFKPEVKAELTEEEERKRRQQEKNRKYAKESRDRKNEKLKKLEMENKQLESALEITRKALSLVYTKLKGPESGWQEYKIVWYPGGKYQDSVDVTCLLPADEELLREIGNSSIGAVVPREVTPATESKSLKRSYPPLLPGTSLNEQDNLANVPTFLEQGQVRGLGSPEQTQTTAQVAGLGSPVCGMELSPDSSRSGEPPRYLPQIRPSESPKSQGTTSPTRRESSEVIQFPDKTNGSPVKQFVPQELPGNFLHQSQPTFTSGGQLPHKPEKDLYDFDTYSENEKFESPWSTSCPDNNNNSKNSSNSNQTAVPDTRVADKQLPLQPPVEMIAGPDFFEICNLSSMDLDPDLLTKFSCEKDS